jgi:hypothetical protein
MVVFDAVVAGDTIVAVGAVSAEDGTGRSAILVAAPPDTTPDVGSSGPGSASPSVPPASDAAPSAGVG